MGKKFLLTNIFNELHNLFIKKQINIDKYQGKKKYIRIRNPIPSLPSVRKDTSKTETENFEFFQDKRHEDCQMMWSFSSSRPTGALSRAASTEIFLLLCETKIENTNPSLYLNIFNWIWFDFSVWKNSVWLTLKNGGTELDKLRKIGWIEWVANR